MILPSTGTALAALLWVAPATYGPIEPAPDPVPAVWQTIAACESDQTWDANTGNGYYGGLQFAQRSWEWAGGLDHAPRADLATPADQVTVAQRLLDLQGWSAWPVCSRKAGLR